MTAQPEDPIDWSLTTWKGSRLQQHREFQALPFARKLELIEEMTEAAKTFAPAHSELRSGRVAEDPPQRFGNDNTKDG